MTVAPDYVEPVVGWRLWYAVDNAGETRLSSVFHKTLWPQNAPLIAVCSGFRISFWPFRRKCHEAPDTSCGCGIHAANMATIRAYLPDQFSQSGALPVVGRVSLWGNVHEYDRGWRASHAYPERLYVPIVELGPEHARIIEDLLRYGVPVRAVGGSSADAMIEEVSALAAA